MGNQQEILLTVPALPEFLRIARVTASGLASRLGFNLDEVDDLRLALDELCFALISKGDETRNLQLRYVIDEKNLIIEGITNRPDSADPVVIGEFSIQILNALVDDHRLWNGDGNDHFMLLKRMTEVVS